MNDNCLARDDRAVATHTDDEVYCFHPYGSRLVEHRGGICCTLAVIDYKFPPCVAVVRAKAKLGK